MGLFDALSVSGSALTTERLRMDVTAENLANAQTPNYRRKEVVVKEAFDQQLGKAMGVQATGIVNDPAPNKQVYDPGNPDANAQGYVSMPDITSVTEMVDLISASRAYEANVTAMQTTKQMFSKTLEILR
ncbi:flagellar basal body rod protein FlgC [Paraconexibacter antarcticus]|uniref:Flagellar basal-body rod protein FlgC n=1 Tax=Paraconexibacter antarcticus TaxID=2949664 RepID=A0ABY5DU96_9ACTN|nr:flagellar basal body rod protein FlgC [Paraconexibacter antarcticus]UTI64657.1 flagellar basal body rod protein FlgC [Paraconexibacter antarcticus]